MAAPLSEQLRMFMTPREIRSEYSTNFADRQDPFSGQRMSDTGMLKRKLTESKNSGLFDSVKEEGVKAPIGLGTMRDDVPAIKQDFPTAPVSGKPMMTSGHHRLASALTSRPDDYVPVIHHTDITEHQGRHESRIPASHRDRSGAVVQPWGRYT
jgi:hypothetical protein